MAYGKATGYSDYFKNNDQTPSDTTDNTDSTDTKDSNMVAQRKAALKRRMLARKKVGMQ